MAFASKRTGNYEIYVMNADGMGRPQQLADLLTRFAPFETDTVNGRVAFRGTGQETASPEWQRAVAAAVG